MLALNRIFAFRPRLEKFGKVLNLIITFKLSISDFVNLKLAISLDIDKLILTVFGCNAVKA